MQRQQARRAATAELTSRTDWRAASRRDLPTRGRVTLGRLADARLSLQKAALCELISDRPIPAAVLVPVVERENELTVLLTQRASS